MSRSQNNENDLADIIPENKSQSYYSSSRSGEAGMKISADWERSDSLVTGLALEKIRMDELL
ncbi:unnamed protein product [marine sediment metagenome]|uniref:Uncharacterized protein n=1 Tax=marine sediment metagenome TaxID=412755 RepID=X0ZFB6_9ZZZZ